jgi:hypothetical protein
MFARLIHPIRLALLGCLLGLLPGVTLADDAIVVQKSAGKSNPRLHLKSFQGPHAVAQRSDLFRLVYGQ